MIKIIQIAILLLLLFQFNTGLYSQEYKVPQLEFVCELKVTCDHVMTLWATTHGVRMIVPIIGGAFNGPKLKCLVLSGGADYQY